MRFLDKIKYKQEMKTLIFKLSYLLEDARNGKATKADVKFWTVYLGRLKEINETGLIKNSDEVYKYYIDNYNKYIKKIKE